MQTLRRLAAVPAAVPLAVLLACSSSCVVHVGGGGVSWGGLHTLARASDPSLPGDGQPATEERSVPAFDRVEISGAFTVRVGVGDASLVRLAGDSNLLEHITTRVEDGVLEVRAERGISPVTPLELDLSAPRLRSLSLSGASDAALAGFDGDELELALSGSNDVVAVGRVDRLVLALSGAQTLDLGELVAREARVSASGSTRAILNVEGQLALSTSGASQVELRGGAEVTSLRQSGSLNLQRVQGN